MSLEWAILPVAGKGTRMYPAAAVVPKALLPVGLRPMLHWALEEALDAGIERLAIVHGPEQELVKDYLRAARDAARADGDGALAALGGKLRDAEVRWVEQPHPAGIGDAFMRCRPLTGDADFGVLLPDNWFGAEEPAIAQVARVRNEHGLCAFGLTEVRPDEAHLFGNVGGVELEELGAGCYRVLALQDKRPGTFGGDAVRARLRGCARYALGPEFYAALSVTGPPAEGEWDDVPAFQRLIAAGRLGAATIEGRHYDVGLPAGYLAAQRWVAGRAQA